MVKVQQDHKKDKRASEQIQADQLDVLKKKLEDSQRQYEEDQVELEEKQKELESIQERQANDVEDVGQPLLLRAVEVTQYINFQHVY